MIARTVRVEGAGEGVIAAPLEAIAKAHPDALAGQLSVLRAEGYGANLVVRGRDEGEVAATVDELIAALQAADVANIIPDPVEAPR